MVGQSWPLMLCLIELEHLISGYFINDGNEKISKGKKVTNIGDEPRLKSGSHYEIPLRDTSCLVYGELLKIFIFEWLQ